MANEKRSIDAGSSPKDATQPVAPAPEEKAGQENLPPLRKVINGVAFAFSALLSPYLVIPFGTVGVVGGLLYPRGIFLRWAALSILFSTVIPALYVVIQILRGKITDVHVMEREQRGGPFLVAILSSFCGAFVLRHFNAPAAVWGIGLVLAINGLLLTLITTRFKISMHVAVLSATIMTALYLMPDLSPWRLVWMIPALMWARIHRGRHTIWQGIAGCLVAGVVTLGSFRLLNLS